jgi:hypothetical protein
VSQTLLPIRTEAVARRERPKAAGVAVAEVVATTSQS